jgi:predicted house-cleaning noncanonical NTP pyrophosphatase (MazG superfamily)
MSDGRIHNKLVRDLVPEILKAKGVDAKVHSADPEEYESVLLEKLREEVLEFKNNKSMDQLADLLDVVDELIKVEHWTHEQVEATRIQRRQEKGTFSKRLVLESTE